MTNGVYVMRVKGNQVPLLFGMLAAEEVARRTDFKMAGNPAMVLANIVYGGMCNHAFVNDLPYPSFSEAVQLVEDWTDEPDYDKQRLAVDDCFVKSKFGKKLLDEWGETEKKLTALAAELDRKTKELKEAEAPEKPTRATRGRSSKSSA